MLMGIRKSFLVACAFCAVALASAPRMARAEFLEVRTGYYGFYTTNTDVEGIGIEWPMNEYEFSHSYGTSGSSVNTYTGTSHTGYVLEPQDNYVVDPSKRLKCSIGFIFNRYQAPGTQYFFFLPPTVTSAWRLSDFSFAYGGDMGQDFTLSIWYCPYGSDPVYSSNYKRLLTTTPEVSYENGVYTINESVIAISFRYYSSKPLNQYEFWTNLVTNGSFSTNSFRPCFNSLPQLFVQPVSLQQDFSGLTVSVDNLGTVTSSITTQTSSINSNIDHEVQSQTSTLMGTSGSDTLFSDQLDGAQESLTQGVFGQLSDLESLTLGWSTDTTRTFQLRFPGVTVLGHELIPAQDVSIWQRGLAQFQDPVRAATTFILFVLWLRGIYWIFYHQILGLDVNRLAESMKD